MMDRVVVYADFQLSQLLSETVTAVDIVHTQSIKEFVETIVHSETTCAGILQPDTSLEESGELVQSLAVSFPLLHFFVLSMKQIKNAGDMVRIISTFQSQEKLAQQLARELEQLDREERRRYHRFSWPLQGYMAMGDDTWTYFDVYSLSAGGAFLKDLDIRPVPGDEYPIWIQFKNCVLEANGKIMERRHSSSNLPAGFGVQFIDLKPESEKILTAIINNSLIQSILESDKEQDIPALDEDMLTPDFTLL